MRGLSFNASLDSGETGAEGIKGALDFVKPMLLGREFKAGLRQPIGRVHVLTPSRLASPGERMESAGYLAAS
jgi:hypothetical protein